MAGSALTAKQARTLSRALQVLSVPFSIGIAEITILAVQHFVPPVGGPSYLLFYYLGEAVGFSTLGAGVPLLLSVLFVVFGVALPAGGGRLGPFRSGTYWLAVLLTSFFSVTVFTVSDAAYGGLTLTPLWSDGYFFAGAFLGVAYSWVRGRKLGLALGFMEAYVLGTTSSFVSDIVRTLTGLVRVPGMAAVWGGEGLHDLLFWFGIYVAWSGLLATFFLRTARSIQVSASKATVDIGGARKDAAPDDYVGA